MRSRLMRRAPVTKTNIVVHSSLHVTVFTQAKGSTSPSLPPQLRNVFSEELVTQLILLSCDYSVEEREYVSLSEPVKKMVMDVTSKVRDEDRIKALEALCWLSSASFCDADRYDCVSPVPDVLYPLSPLSGSVFRQSPQLFVAYSHLFYSPVCV